MPGVREVAPHNHWDDQYSSYSENQSDMLPYHRSSVHSNGYSTDGQQSVVGEDTPTYVMEHLATFTVSKETGIVYPADGMRKLRQLEKSNGIWSQKMQMRLDRNWVLIMDFETGAIMERFPVSLIQEPTPFTSNDPMEIYNNILVFIVGEERPERSDRSSSRSEMHIFQCQRISAEELVEDLKMLRVGKVPPGRQSRHIPPPPATPPPEPPNNGINVREQVSVFNAASHQPDPRGAHGELGPNIYPPRDGNLNDETSSTSSEKYERDVTILNHCFDDIEKFIARLQHAAAASRELERRRRSRKSKKKDLGDGMLTMRAKPPPEGEFIDIFQKFKLSFNLLAKLKAHIHDPNAPELVHFLFTPLALIVDASHDTHYGPNLPAKVVSPMLTREAVNLLTNCVTSKETELWSSLGDAWLLSRDQWKHYVPPYHPVFLDGWSPDYPVADERDPSGGSLGVASPPEDKRTAHEPDLPEQHYHREPERADSHYSSDYFDYDQQEASPPDVGRYYGGRPDRYRDERLERERSQSPGGSDHDFPSGPPISSVPVTSRDISARSDISADSIERNGGGESQQRFERAQTRWLEELRSRGAKVVQVTYPRTANNDKELTVIRGEYLEVVDDSRKWWKARNSRGHVAHVPHTIVTPYQPGSGEAGDVFTAPVHPPRGYDRHYSGQESPRDSGAAGDGRPTRSPPIPPPAPADWVRKERLGKKDDSDLSSDEDGLPITSRSRAINNAPPPPPLPAPGTISAPSSPKLTRSKSGANLSRNSSSQDLQMQEELKHVLTMYRNKPRLGIVKTPEVYIDHKSNPEEVQKWLKDKGFSDEVSKKLNGMSGSELFDLKREQLEKYCGPKEGRRLDSQLTIQRNVSGYKTARSSELRAVLAKVRTKVERPPATSEKSMFGFLQPSNSLANTEQKNSPPPPPTPSSTSSASNGKSEDSIDKSDSNSSTLSDLIQKQRLKIENKNGDLTS